MGGDLGDGALLAGVTEVLEGLAGALKGLVPAPLGRGDEVVAVVRAHRMSPSHSMFGRLPRRIGSQGARY